MDLQWPFFGLADEAGRSLGYACVQGPARTPEEARTLATLAAAVPVIGFTSYLSFPACHELGDSRDYESLCVAWCHCFRDPTAYFRTKKPLLLLSYSDFTDYSFVSPDRLFLEAAPRKDFDFVYVCQPGEWKEGVKNWELAQRC